MWDSQILNHIFKVKILFNVEVEVNIHNTALLSIPIYFYILLSITQWSGPNISLIEMDVHLFKTSCD